jgi:hypothetical protein
MADLSAILARPVPAKPATFAPELAPDGVEVKFVTFVLDRPIIAPRSILTHTNAASREGSVESAWNWSHAAPNTNTVPTYQVDRRHDGVWARKMLPSNRRAIANATVTSSHSDWDRHHGARTDSGLVASDRNRRPWLPDTGRGRRFRA